jgi:quercetin dioxygenase-like cupin family protein
VPYLLKKKRTFPTPKRTNLMSNNKEIEKGASHIIVEIIEHVSNAIVSRTIINKTTGNITATSMAVGEELGEKRIAFDTYVQIIDGAAEVMIDGKSILLKLGEGIVIPAHSQHSFTANERFKMITTVIKSGYEG